MKRDVITSMKAQMTPGAQARAALEEKLVKRRSARPAAWRRYAAAAACVTLALAAWPLYRLGSRPAETDLHSYTIVERNGENPAVKAPAPEGGEAPPTPDVELSTVEEPIVEPGPSEESRTTAILQYDNFIGHLRGEDGWVQFPEWYGGHDPYTDPDRLTVFFTQGYRTPELEAQITDWCGGGGVAFGEVKYSWNYLAALLGRVGTALDEDDIDCSCGIDGGSANCLRLDVFGPLDEAAREAFLARVAELDPDDDAIRVWFFEDGGAVDERIIK